MLPLMLGCRSLIWIIKQHQQATRPLKPDINPSLLIASWSRHAELSRDLLIPLCRVPPMLTALLSWVGVGVLQACISSCNRVPRRAGCIGWEVQLLCQRARGEATSNERGAFSKFRVTGTLQRGFPARALWWPSPTSGSASVTLPPPSAPLAPPCIASCPSYLAPTFTPGPFPPSSGLCQGMPAWFFGFHKTQTHSG